MRISDILALAAAFFISECLPFATAEDASFSILQAKIAEAEAEIAQQYLVKLKHNAKGRRVLSKLKNGEYEGVEFLKLMRGKIAVINFADDDAGAAFKEAAMSGVKIMEHGK